MNIHNDSSLQSLAASTCGIALGKVLLKLDWHCRIPRRVSDSSSVHSALSRQLSFTLILHSLNGATLKTGKLF